jgi:uncharacterized Zn finger protein
MHFQIRQPCPRCGKPVSIAIVERHPTRTDIALFSFECMDCGSVRMKALSLCANKSPLELAVLRPPAPSLSNLRPPPSDRHKLRRVRAL